VLLVVDVGNTQTHFATFRDGEIVEHWRFATVRTSTADELGRRCATCSSCAG
jgi:type III pantothenate kinase